MLRAIQPVCPLPVIVIHSNADPVPTLVSCVILVLTLRLSCTQAGA